MAFNLFDFQAKGIESLAEKLRVLDSVCAVSPGGSGKTVIFSTITNRFIKANDKNVIIFVHSNLLLQQTRKQLYEKYGIVAQKIDSDTTYIDTNSRVFVAMVETFDRRSNSDSFLKNFDNIGLMIIDECHLGNFKKLFVHFYKSKRIGFTATPLATDKKDPLKNYYQDMVIIATPTKLISLNRSFPNMGIVPSDAYSLGVVDRNSVKIKGGEFDEEENSREFRKKYQISNTLDAYLKRGYGKKTIVFNADIKHSIEMHEAFLKAGLNSMHVNGPTSNKEYKKYGTDSYKEYVFKWFKETPNAILNNVGIATTGFDEPSIETVIVNRLVNSLTLWIQMIVRGSRPYQYSNGIWKEDFLLLDMGNNAPEEGGNLSDGNCDIDWDFMFRNPKLPRPGIGSIKMCPQCGALNNTSSRVCRGLKIDFLSEEEVECNYIFSVIEKQEDTISRELIKVISNIDVKKNIEYFKNSNEYRVYHEIYNQIINYVAQEFPKDLDYPQLLYIYSSVYKKTTEWFKLANKRKFPNFRYEVKQKILTKLKEKGINVDLEHAEMLLNSE